MKKIAILTSGGDSPGMNAAISSIVKHTLNNNIEVFGIKYGFKGLLNKDIVKLQYNDIENIFNKAGTILKSARYNYFKTEKGQIQALENLKLYSIDGLIIIGGNGTLKGGARLLSKHFPVIGIPSTIDNDVPGTDYSIGFDTALNTVIDSIEKIRDSISSIERTIVVEVMGRSSGKIALYSGLATEANAIIIPELEYDINKIIQQILKRKQNNKMYNIIVVAEGVSQNHNIQKLIEEKTGLETRTLILGYLQRGGSPSAYDKIIASKMGVKAVNLLLENKKFSMVRLFNGKISQCCMEEVLKHNYTSYDLDYDLIQNLLNNN